MIKHLLCRYFFQITFFLAFAILSMPFSPRCHMSVFTSLPLPVIFLPVSFPLHRSHSLAPLLCPFPPLSFSQFHVIPLGRMRLSPPWTLVWPAACGRREYKGYCCADDVPSSSRPTSRTSPDVPIRSHLVRHTYKPACARMHRCIMHAFDIHTYAQTSPN